VAGARVAEVEGRMSKVRDVESIDIVRIVRHLNDLDDHGYPRWFGALCVTAALTFVGWAFTWILP
jgi:hypothetical protein